MARYIDVEPLEEKLKEHIKKTESELMLGALSTFVRLLDITPTADVAPVRHGHWVEMSYDEYKCSVCEKVVREEILYAIKPSDREDASMHIANYCPNCGARMDAKE